MKEDWEEKRGRGVARQRGLEEKGREMCRGSGENWRRRMTCLKV